MKKNEETDVTKEFERENFDEQLVLSEICARKNKTK